jgi:hypothetical protein
MAYTAKVPGFGSLEKQGARAWGETFKGDAASGPTQPDTGPQQQPRTMRRGFGKRGGRKFSRK